MFYALFILIYSFAGSKITHGMNASHQDKTRAALFARYQERQ